MTSFVLKIIAIISMLCDHVSLSLQGHFSFYNYIGRFAFPIFAFQISQGYIHTKNIKKYIIRLFTFACISQIPFMMFLNSIGQKYTLNVLFTLLLGVFALICYDKIKDKFLSFSCIFFLCTIAQLFKVDYGAFGVIIILLFYIFYKLYSNDKLTIKQKYLYKAIMCICFILAVICYYLPRVIQIPSLSITYFKLCIFTCMPLLFILLYNGKQGPKIKYLFYIFYPLHLFLLWIIYILK